MNSSRLVDFFEQKQKITPEQANEVRVALASGSQNEEAVLLEKDLAKQEDIARAKSEMFNIPYVDLRQTKIDDSIFTAISLEKLKKYRAIPFERAGHITKIAMSDPFDVQAIQAMESLLKEKFGGRLLVHITTADNIDFVIDSNIGGLISSEVSEALQDVDSPVTELDETSGELSDMDLQNAPVARIVNSILQYAVKSSASDIHIEPMETTLRVRFRVHGIMLEKLVLPKNLKSSVVARLKIMSNLKIDEKRVPQDGRLQIVQGDKKFDVRVSTLPSIYGEKVVMRLLDRSSGVPKIETSGLRGNAYKKVIDASTVTNGIILVTGPTGSGKSTTLAGILSKVNDPKVNIVTLENPVEIRIPGITQVQINPDVGLTFANGLRSILRQDPDIVMVGEIRDHETADLAVEASLTGHLVLSTLHTNSAAAAIPRLLDMGVESYLLASTLRLAVAQRLPRRICDDCKEAYPVTDEVLENVKKVLSEIPNFEVFSYLKSVCDSAKDPNAPEHLKHMKCPDVSPDGKQQMYMYRGKGCQHCNNSGYKGRIGIFEVLQVNEELRRVIVEKPTEDDIVNVSLKQGTVRMMQDGYLKALEGMTTLEEVLRVSKE